MSESLRLKAIRSDYSLRPILRSTIRDIITCYDDFTALIHAQLEIIFKDMTRNANFFQKQNEDQITYHIISQFRPYGISAKHDTQIGGHVDISIEYDDYMWLAEAKKHSSYDKLYKGWNQLTTRYSTGISGEDNGAFLIYNFNKDALSVTNEWKSFLSSKDSTIQFSEHNIDLNFVSNHVHVRSGRSYKVIHYNIPLHFEPQDVD